MNKQLVKQSKETTKRSPDIYRMYGPLGFSCSLRIGNSYLFRAFRIRRHCDPHPVHHIRPGGAEAVPREYNPPLSGSTQ